MEGEMDIGNLDRQVTLLSMMTPYLSDEVLKNIQNAERTFGIGSPQFNELMKAIMEVGASYGNAKPPQTTENHHTATVEQKDENQDIVMQESSGLGFTKVVIDQDTGNNFPGQLHGFQRAENQPPDRQKNAVPSEDYPGQEEDTLHLFRNLRLAMEEKCGK